MGHGLIENLFVRCSWQIFENPNDIETLLAKRFNGRAEKVLVRQKLHAGSSG